MNKEKVLEIKNVTKSYFENKGKKNEIKTTVLYNVSLVISKGDFISVMGPSGSGKSTLLYTASGMEQADSGEIILYGENLETKTDDELTRIRRDKFGFVFQQPSLLQSMSILDNITLLAIQKNKKNRTSIIEKAKLLMKETDIFELADRDITKVSGGQLQRAGICRALMNNPTVLFADEPTGALNSKSSDEIMQLFLKINSEGNTILLVTHDSRIAAKSSKVEFMVDGKIVKELNLEEYKESDLEERVNKINSVMQELGV